ACAGAERRACGIEAARSDERADDHEPRPHPAILPATGLLASPSSQEQPGADPHRQEHHRAFTAAAAVAAPGRLVVDRAVAGAGVDRSDHAELLLEPGPELE